MYDPVTAELIRSSPSLTDLDPASLPDRFSETFAHIAAARIRLQERTERVPAELSTLVSEMRRLAYAHETLLSVLPQRDDRTAAAFVAATAHQLTANAERALTSVSPPTELGANRVSSDIAAMLLFLVAEAMADAAEMARLLRVQTEQVIERALILALRDLALGRWSQLIARPVPPRRVVWEEDGPPAAPAALYRLILEGVHALARVVFEPHVDPPTSPTAIFEQARSLSVAEPTSAGFGIHGVMSAFPGPHHLASLLVPVSRGITANAVSRIAAPDDLASPEWRRSLQRIARSRPLLWKNHRQAIDQGCLVPGVSSVVAFPTGAGKSTLAELKINATLLSGKRVVFLAPTNALVDQTSRSLQDLFSDYKVQGKHADDFLLHSGEDVVPHILVLTPEACLSQMAIEGALFQGVALLVFDECHLLHPTDRLDDRRSIDAMLCLVGFATSHPEADFLLLSAMMKNSGTLAGWISELTSRPCLALDLPWKPTRQLRGSVVYEQQRVTALIERIGTAKRSRTTKAPPASLKRDLTARPLAFFSLKQTWESTNKHDYALISLGDASVALGASDYWKLTPNFVDVTAKLATAAAQSGIKTLAFFQSIVNAGSAAAKIATALGTAEISLEQDEQRWLRTAILELGGADHLYLALDGDRITAYASVHHALLLPQERRVCEALYRREDGLKVLTATSTVAQGMNFPCELVIIGEDSRFNQELEAREVLAAQELLNAAGRAGRAGENSAGIVLVVPGKVVGIDLKENTIGLHWATLRKIFGQSDQCLEIDDPLTAILDRVNVDIEQAGEIERYVVARLAAEGTEDSDAERLSAAIAKTLGAYKAARGGDASWLEQRVTSAVRFLAFRSDDTDASLKIDYVAARFGLSIELVRRISEALVASAPSPASNIPEWRDWFLDWFVDNVDLLEKVFLRQNLRDLFGPTKYNACQNDEEKQGLVCPILGHLTRLWMEGHPLVALESAIGTDAKKLGKCNKARRFALRFVPTLAYLFHLPTLLHEHSHLSTKDFVETFHARTQLSRCMRVGLDSYEKAALNQIQPALSRREIHMKYARLRRYVEPGHQNEPWGSVVARIEQAVEAEQA